MLSLLAMMPAFAEDPPDALFSVPPPAPDAPVPPGPKLRANRSDWRVESLWEDRIRAALGGTDVPVIEAAILKKARKCHARGTYEAANRLVTTEIEKYLARCA